MKKDKSFVKRVNRLILSVLTTLGFLPVSAQGESQKRYDKTEDDDSLQFIDVDDEESIYEPIAAYGCPRADFVLRGTVTDEYGKALPDVDVVVKMCDDEIAVSKTDETGSFDIKYTNAPWCDINISLTRDADTVVDTTILSSEFVFEGHDEGDVWYNGTYEVDMQVSLGENSEKSQINLNSPVLADFEDVENQLFRIVNPVENYMWFNFRNVSTADVTITDISGRTLKHERVNDGTNIYVGDLKCGEYVVTAVSGANRFSALFIKNK